MTLSVKAWELTTAEYDALPWDNETYLNPAIVAAAQRAKLIWGIMAWLRQEGTPIGGRPSHHAITANVLLGQLEQAVIAAGYVRPEVGK